MLYVSPSGEARIIDPVLGYDQSSGMIDVQAADKVIAFIKERRLLVHWILETPVYANHLMTACYLKQQLGGKISMGDQIQKVLNF